jgi:hypothetical protein
MMRLSLRAILAAVAASIAIVTGASLATASTAYAGTYTVYGCRTPSGGAAPMGSWQVGLDSSDGYHHDFWGSTCPDPVFMGMDAGFSHVDGDYAEETFVAPPNTTIQSYAISRAVRLVPSAGYLYQAWVQSAGRWQLLEGCTSASTCGTYGDYQDPAAGSNLLRHTAPTDTTAIELKVTCARSGGCPSVKSEGHVTDSVWIFASAITLSDNFSPQFASPPSGPLVAGGVLAGVEPVTIAATDKGSGVYQAMIEVDGRVLQQQVLNSNGGACEPPFVAAVPCQLSTSGTLEFNTGELSDGEHSLTLLVSDAAGNTAVWGPIVIRTLNNPCSPVPAAGGMSLRASFRIRRHRRIHFANSLTTGSTNRPLVVGRVTTAAGAPVPGAAVCVAVRDDYAGAPLKAAGTLSANADGGFAYRLGHGPSRTIYFIHRVPGGAISTALGLHIHVPVRVHVNAHHLFNGQVMTWRGRLPGPRSHGMLGLMQVWRGSFWQTFEEISVGRGGKWLGRYRFSFTTGVQRYLFRLVVPHQPGYPYAAGVSRNIEMLVTG